MYTEYILHIHNMVYYILGLKKLIYFVNMPNTIFPWLLMQVLNLSSALISSSLMFTSFMKSWRRGIRTSVADWMSPCFMNSSTDSKCCNSLVLLSKPFSVGQLWQHAGHWQSNQYLAFSSLRLSFLIFRKVGKNS